MHKNTLITLGLGLTLSLLAAPAQAVLMFGTFTAEVTQSDNASLGSGFADGLSLTGEFRYESDPTPALTTSPGSPSGTWYEFSGIDDGWIITGLRIDSIPLTLDLDPQALVDDTSGLPVYSDRLLVDDTPGNDFMQVSLERYADDGNFDYAEYYFDLFFGSTTFDFVDAALGVEQSYVLGEAEGLYGDGVLNMTSDINGNLDYTFLIFDLTSVTLSRDAPEPGMLSLLGIGLLGLACARRRA